THTGTADALGSWVDRIYLSSNDILDASDRLIGELAHAGPLAKGANYTGQLDLALPVELSGPRFVLLQTDAAGQVTELDGENNNVTSSAISITLAPFADLAVSNVTGPAQAIGDPAPITVSWTVTNLGTGAGMTDSWIDNIIASTDSTQGNGDEMLLALFPHTGFLQVDESYTRSETFLLPPAFQGRFHLFVRTDATGVVFENGSETNNVAEAAHTFDAMPIPYADLTVTAVTAPSAGNSGQPLRISWSVQNQGIGATNTTSWI